MSKIYLQMRVSKYPNTPLLCYVAGCDKLGTKSLSLIVSNKRLLTKVVTVRAENIKKTAVSYEAMGRFLILWIPNPNSPWADYKALSV